jgi:hypothetical protein
VLAFVCVLACVFPVHFLRVLVFSCALRSAQFVAAQHRHVSRIMKVMDENVSGKPSIVDPVSYSVGIDAVTRPCSWYENKLEDRAGRGGPEIGSCEPMGTAQAALVLLEKSLFTPEALRVWPQRQGWLARMQRPCAQPAAVTREEIERIAGVVEAAVAAAHVTVEGEGVPAASDVQGVTVHDLTISTDLLNVWNAQTER